MNKNIKKNNLEKSKPPIFIVNLLAFMALAHACWFIGIPIVVYYGIFILLGTVFVIKGQAVNKNMICLILACAVSIAFNDIPYFFTPWFRFCSFVIMLITISPLIQSEWIILFRKQLYDKLNTLLTIAVILSFIGYILRIPRFMHVGLLNGLFKHSMLLGPISAVVFIKYLNYWDSEKHPKINKTILFIAAITCLLASSRGALVGMMGATFCFLFLKYRNNFYLILKSLIIFVFIVCISYPIWAPYSERIAEKQEANMNKGGTFASRESLWQDRINEFKSSPVIGIGFASVDVNSAGSFSRSGTIEPGSSWLFLLSSIGLLGTLFFTILVANPFIYFITQIKENTEMPYMLAVLFFFMIHLCVEGYILASGSSLFFYFWLSLGIIYDNMRNSKDNKVNEVSTVN